MLKSIPSAHVHLNGDLLSKMKALEMGDFKISIAKENLCILKSNLQSKSTLSDNT